jgi:transposase
VPTARRGGRPSKLTDEAAARIVEAVRAGNTRRAAAQHAGVGASTLRAWLAGGRRQRRGRFQAFLAAVKKAEAEAVVAAVAIIRRAAEGGQLLRHTVTTRRDGSTVEGREAVDKALSSLATGAAVT